MAQKLSPGGSRILTKFLAKQKLNKMLDRIIDGHHIDHETFIRVWSDFDEAWNVNGQST